MQRPQTACFERYVALGDSSTEGVDDPDGAGGFRGWSQRLAEKIAAGQGRATQLHYANLAVRGLTTGEILEQQLAPALEMHPDLATLFCGTNDVIRLRFDAARVAADIERMERALVDSGATVLSFTLPDLTPVMPVARLIAPRIAALNRGLADAARSTGAILVDFAAHSVATDHRLWSGDRIHANSEGHARIAEALADALKLPGSDGSWSLPLPVTAARGLLDRLGSELYWLARHLLPWLLEGLAGTLAAAVSASPATRRLPKRPRLAPL